jgi:peptidoglycan/LPS O-acetylase OafA/YrhL
MQSIKYLTPLRGVAALLVVLFHIQFWLKDLQAGLSDHTSFIARGYIWVDLFFILSGFILTHVYGKNFKKGTNKAPYIRFLQARFARIYPLYFITLIAYLLLWKTLGYLSIDYEAFHWPDRFTAESFVSNIFMTQSFGLHDFLSWNYPSWSVSAELVVYLFFPFVIVFSQKNISSFILITVVSSLFLYLYVEKGNIDFTYNMGVIRCSFEFLLGVYLYKNLFNREFFLLQRSAAVPVFTFLSIVVLLHFPVEVVSDLIFLPLFMLLILALSKYRGDKLSFLNSRYVIGLGNISYSLYIWHFLVIELSYLLLSPELMNRKEWHPNILETGIFIITILISLLAVSILSYRFIEVPTRRYFKKRFV